MADVLATPLLHLEDVFVGQQFPSSVFELDEASLKDFARQFDPQPFHLDDEAARSTVFGGLAASGWHTAAITMRLMVESVPVARGMIGAGAEITWPMPTRAGDRLRVSSTVLEIKPSRSKPDRAIILLESLTFNQHEEVVQRLVSRVVLFKRSSEGIR